MESDGDVNIGLDDTKKLVKGDENGINESGIKTIITLSTT